jgi:hypothetical protein
MGRRHLAVVGVIIFLIILLFPVWLNALRGGIGKEPSKPDLVLPAEGKCVKDSSFMRANHMDLLKEARVKTVREGVRNLPYSLKNCIRCHTNHDNFCGKCHNYVGVKTDCFDCHYYPGREIASK